MTFISGLKIWWVIFPSILRILTFTAIQQVEHSANLPCEETAITLNQLPNTEHFSTILRSRRPGIKRALKRESAILIAMPPTPNPALRLGIKDILGILHHRYPEANYLEYEERLRNQGVNVLADVLDLDAAFYMNILGMSWGAVYFLRKWAVEAGMGLSRTT